jgi:hypothetical protein
MLRGFWSLPWSPCRMTKAIASLARWSCRGPSNGEERRAVFRSERSPYVMQWKCKLHRNVYINLTRWFCDVESFFRSKASPHIETTFYQRFRIYTAWLADVAGLSPREVILFIQRLTAHIRLAVLLIRLLSSSAAVLSLFTLAL